MVPDHVGIVEKVEGGMIYTIEGNSAGGSVQTESKYGRERLNFELWYHLAVKSTAS